MTRRRAQVLAEDVDALAPRARFKRALRLTAMATFVPGLAQLTVGRRWVGVVALTGWVMGLVALVVVGWNLRDDRAALIGLAADADVLLVARVLLAVGVLVWVGLFVDAWRLAHPRRLTRGRAVVVVALNTAILLGVGTVSAYAWQVSGVQREVVQQVFTAEETNPPLEGRYNILLLGSDAGDNRFGLRPDSLTIVSIDATTGATVLVSLPRNLQLVPFPEDSPMHALYPNGYDCGSECLLNAVYTEAHERTDLYPDAEDPGMEATLDAVEGATGLEITYHVMVDMDGFSDLIDAVGGVEVDVRDRIATFSQHDQWKQTYIEPGLQRLDGEDALWYARSRVQSDDFTRMGRQKCLMAAMLDQLSPQTVLLNVTDIARSSARLISTDIPAGELGSFADLALKARGTQVRTVSLVPPAVNPGAPDYVLVHEMVADAVAASEGRAGSAASPSPSPDAVAATPGTGTPTTEVPAAGGTPESPYPGQSGGAANNVDDLASAC